MTNNNSQVEYTAKLIGVENLEREQCSVSYSLNTISQWADSMVKKYPRGRVEVYSAERKLLFTRVGEKAMIYPIETTSCRKCNHPADAHLLSVKNSPSVKYGACNYCSCKSFFPAIADKDKTVKDSK